ncbi:MAG: hypothetical protein P8186_24885 [Anaerolineae bacterium]|jgi:hypothetical protein
MSTLEWILATTLFVLYISFLFTVAVVTFKKGHTVLGIIGIFFPILWLIGAVLPAKAGSRYEVEERMRWDAQVQEWTR